MSESLVMSLTISLKDCQGRYCIKRDDELSVQHESPVGCAVTLLLLVACFRNRFTVSFGAVVAEHCLISVSVMFCRGPFGP